jgi:hypothetical protein
VFLVGAMGSGTTLLRLMLDSHPNIAIPHETGFMRAYNAHRYVPFKWSGRGWARRLGWNDKDFDEAMAAFYDTLFMRYATQHGKHRWGEKTPLHTWHVDGMRRLFPAAQFVAIVRHPCASIASNTNRFRDPFDRFRIHYGRYTREVVRQAARYPRRFSLLRYEDLVLRPEPTMRELLRRLGEPWADEVLAHHEVQGKRTLIRPAEGKTDVSDPIDVSRISKWTTQLDHAQRAAIRDSHGRLAEFLGYDVDDPAVLAPLSPRGEIVITGGGVRRRIEAFPDLDLTTRGPVPRNEQLYDPRRWELIEASPLGSAPQVSTAIPPVRRAAIKVVRRVPARLRRRALRTVGSNHG